MPHELRVHIFTSDRRDGEALHVLNLSVANFTRISAIKALLEQRLGVPVGQQVLQYQRRELHNDEALDDSIPQGARIDFSLRMPDLQASGQWGIVSLRSQCPFPPELEEVLVQVRRAGHTKQIPRASPHHPLALCTGRTGTRLRQAPRTGWQWDGWGVLPQHC